MNKAEDMKEIDETDNGILGNPKLRENPFGVPAGYFKDVQESVMAQIAQTAPQAAAGGIPAEGPDGRNRVYRLLQPALGLAASFLVILGLGWGAMKITGSIAPQDRPSTYYECLQAEHQTDTLSIQDYSFMLRGTLERYGSAIGEINVEPPMVDEKAIEQYLIDTRMSFSSIASLE